MIWIRSGWQVFCLDSDIPTEKKLSSALLFH